MTDKDLTRSERSESSGATGQGRQRNGDRTRDERVPRGDATIDERSARTRRTRLRTNLPDELLTRFDPLRNLDVSAGQADLVLCRDRASGDEVVVKLYRNAEQLDLGVLARLYRANPDHVVKLIDHGESDGELWEVQEYCSLGTLTDLRNGQGGRLQESETLVVVRELAESLHHLQHDLDVTHRDLKPENVLVRSLEPLDLVLTDFGASAEQIGDSYLKTVVASRPWAAPEVQSKGVVARPIDWWPLGAIVFQLLTGRHLLADADGRLPEEKQARAIIIDGLYTTDAIRSARWRNLVDGLLSYRMEDRWGYSEVTAWLAGRNPNVVRTVPRNQLVDRRETDDIPYVFNGHKVTTGAQLISAMRADWEATGDALAGRMETGLVKWLETRPSGPNAIKALGLESTPGARFIRLQATLDPGSPLQFRGRVVDDQSLTDTILKASAWTPEAEPDVDRAHAWLVGLRRERVLAAMAAVLDGEAAKGLGLADQRLNTWNKQAEDLVRELPPTGQAAARSRMQALVARLFAVAMGAEDAAPLIEEAKVTARAADTERQQWAKPLVDGVLAAKDEALGYLVGAQAVLAVVTDETRAAKAREEAERKAAERREAQARRDADAQRRNREREATARARRARLLGQIAVRGGLSAVYALITGIAVLLPAGPTSPAELVGAALPLLGMYLVPVGLAIALDWVLNDPAGPLRALGTATGLAIGLVGMAGWYFNIGETMGAVLPTTSDLMVLPWGIGIGWIVGGALQFGLNLLTGTADRTVTVRGIRRVRAWLWPVMALATLSGLTLLFVGRCIGGCGAANGIWGATYPLSQWLHVDLLGIGSDPTVLGRVLVVGLGLFLASPQLTSRNPVLGAASAIVGGMTGLLAFLAYPPSPLTMVGAWIVRIGGWA